MNIRLFSFLILLCSVVLTFTLPGCGKSDSPHSDKVSSGEVKKQMYHCPMHTSYITDHPGNCPICNMTLVPIKDDESKDSKSSMSDSMSGMKQSDNQEISTENKMIDRVSISLSPEKRQMIGLSTSKVEKRNLSTVVRTTAVVEHDETRLAKISPRFNGWVRMLYINFTGEPIDKGQPLFVAYSPELLVSEKEYLISLRNYENVKGSPDDERKQSAKLLLESSRKKLELFEINEDEIRNLEKNRIPSDEILFRAPFSGHVISKTAIEGKAFTSGETLFEIADLSHLWLRGFVFEYEMPLISVGQDVIVTFPYLGNKIFRSKITFIYPHIDALTRRGEIRVELDNPNNLLRPEMWANIEINIPLGEKLAIPSSAVIDTGKRFIAFVDAKNGYIEPRELKIGAKTDDYYEVLEGVSEGEKVVTRALFFVDSESQLKTAISGMSGHEGHNQQRDNNKHK